MEYKPTSKSELLEIAWKNVSTFRKFFQKSLDFASAGKIVSGNPDMSSRIREAEQRAEKVWPFIFNEGTLGMRKGLVITKDGKPVDVLLTEVS
jgi:hypothetical protein